MAKVQEERRGEERKIHRKEGETREKHKVKEEERRGEMKNR